jgi:hypothetical protein
VFQDGSGGTRLLLSALGLHGLERASLCRKNALSREETGHDRAVLLRNAALVNNSARTEKENSLTENAPCNRHPVGRGVLLGPPLADLGVANAVLANEQSLQIKSVSSQQRAYNQVPGAGARSTFEGPPV